MRTAATGATVPLARSSIRRALRLRAEGAASGRPDVSTTCDIKIEGTTGDFKVTNVNGGIEMLDIAGRPRRHHQQGREDRLPHEPVGSVIVQTLNGDVVESFSADCSPPTSRMKTFNEQDVVPISSDYAMPAPTPRVSRKGSNKFGLLVRPGGMACAWEVAARSQRFETLQW